MGDDIKFLRRGVLRTGLAILAGGVLATAARADDTKVDPSTVQYQTTPNSDGSKCSTCTNFVAPNACKVVSGTISPNGYCVAYAPKGS